MTIVFLDRDGVINENKPDDYVRNWEEFVFLPNAKEALRRLSNNDEVKIFIVSNQANLNCGRMNLVAPPCIRSDDPENVY